MAATAALPGLHGRRRLAGADAAAAHTALAGAYAAAAHTALAGPYAAARAFLCSHRRRNAGAGAVMPVRAR